jgi:hypothetical protein
VYTDKELRELAERVGKMEPLEPSRKPPPLFYVHLGLLAAVLVYIIANHKPSKPWTKADMDRAVREMAQEDARKELEQAADAYRRTLREPSPSR